MIILTSFKESVNLLKHSGLSDANVYSVARFQPEGFNYINLPFFAAQDADGNKLRLRGRKDPLNDYRKDLWKYYKSVWPDIREWVDALDNKSIDMLCCWCPHASHSKDQMRIYGNFVCHTGLIGRLISSLRRNIDIYMDNDHSVHLVEEYKPLTFKQLVL